MRRLKLKWLKYSFGIALFLSCNKDQRQFEKKIEHLNKGKYELVSEIHHITTGEIDTFTQNAYGPFIYNTSFNFRIEKTTEKSMSFVSIEDNNSSSSTMLIATDQTVYFDVNYTVSKNYLQVNLNSADTLVGYLTFKKLE